MKVKGETFKVVYFLHNSEYQFLKSELSQTLSLNVIAMITFFYAMGRFSRSLKFNEEIVEITFFLRFWAKIISIIHDNKSHAFLLLL